MQFEGQLSASSRLAVSGQESLGGKFTSFLEIACLAAWRMDAMKSWLDHMARWLDGCLDDRESDGWEWMDGGVDRR